MANTIDIMGKLNAITTDQVIAGAEQIELTLQDGTKTKLPNELLKYTIGMKSGDIITFLDYAQKNHISENKLIICTEASDSGYETGHIYFYNGSTESLNDITPMTGGGSTSGIRLTVNFRETVVNNNTPFSVPFTWTSNNTGYGYVYCLIDGALSQRIRMQPGTSSWSISGLSRGNHQLMMYVVDSGNQTSEQWQYTLSVGSLELTSDFDASEIFSMGSTIRIPYTYYNNDTTTTDTLIYQIDDQPEVEVQISPVLNISNLSAGNHTLTMKIKTVSTEGIINYSNELNYDILVAEAGVLYVTPVGNTTIVIKEKERLTLTVRVTYLGAEKFTAKLKAFKKNGDGWEEDPTEYAPDATWYNGNNSFIITNLPQGEYKLVVQVSYSDDTYQEVEYLVTVEESELLYINQIVDDTMLLHLSAKGKSNDDINRDKWIDSSVSEIQAAGYEITRDPVPVILHNFNFGTNGWIPDSTGQTRLVIDSGAYVEIDLEPLAKEVEHGFTFDIEFSTRDVLDASARVVSCFNGQRGFWIDTENATLSNNNSKTQIEVVETEVTTDIITDYDEEGNPIYLTYTQYTQTGPFQTNFPSDEKTRITFVINRGELKNGSPYFGDYQFASMDIYVNGVLTSVEKISDYTDLVGTQFENGGMKIMLGCDNDLAKTGYAEIYNIRAYNRALSMEEILVNYISDIEDPQTQSDMIRRNSLAGAVSTDLPVMDLYFTPEDLAVMTKDNKVMGRCIFTNYNGSTENFDKFCRCQWQGTSSLAYAVKNYKIKLYNDINQDSKFKFDLGNGIKENTFTLKADYMDSSHCRNTGTANFVSNLGTELCPAQEFIPACRTAIYGFPMLLYITTTNNRDPITQELLPTEEELRNNRQLIGVFNFNLDKGDTDSLSLYTQKDMKKELKDNAELLQDFEDLYPNWDCMSFEGSANSDTTAGAFASVDDDSIYSDFEMRFEDMDDILDEGTKESNGTYSVLDDGTVQISNINSDIDGIYTKENNTLKSNRNVLTKTDGNVTESLVGNYTTHYVYKPDVLVTLNFAEDGSITSKESGESRIARRYGHLKKLIQWVMDADDATFKRDFEKHFFLKGTIDYFLVVFVLLMADNLGKNCMWNTWGPISQAKYRENPEKYSYTDEEIEKYDNYIWVPQFYDMDTMLGLDNSGNMRFDVYDEIEPGIFNTSNSRLWTKFRKVFATEIKNRYMELRTYSPDHSSFTLQSFLEYYYNGQIEKISETNYNNDVREKYLKHDNYLFMCHGRQYEYLRRFFDQRLYFIDSVYETGEDWGKQSTIRVEYGDFATKPVTFQISTYKPSYVQIIFTAAEGNTKKLKVPRNGTVEFSGYVNTATDQEVIIYMAPNIKTIGDISPYTPKLVEISEMEKLTELSVGTEENPNPNLSSLSLGNNTYLTRLIIENCTALGGTVNVQNCTNLKYVSTVGSTISYIQFNNNGGALEEAHFSYAIKTVNLNKFPLLKEISFERLDNLTTLIITECPILTGYQNEDGSVVNGYIYGNILNNWAPTDRNTSITLTGYGNMDSYAFLDACSLLHENYGQTNRRINLGGTITYLGTSIPTRYSTYKNYFPNLTVRYPNVTDVSGMFRNYQNINAIISRQIPIVNEVTGDVSYVTKYYWRDPKASKFESVLEDGYRPIEYYDDDDQTEVADEIKDRLQPFERFLNMNEMFYGCQFIEKIHPETFDNIDVSNASTNSMFYNCNKLKYIEFPKVTELQAYTFNDVSDAIIFIPNTVKQFSDYAFSCSTYLKGNHQIVLFEDEKNNLPETINYVRDCRFGIKRHENGRALITEKILCHNLVNKSSQDVQYYEDESEELNISYFTNDQGKLVYDVYRDDGTKIGFTTWNQILTDNSVPSLYDNPLNLYEMLQKSMTHFDLNKLQEISIPSFDMISISGDNIQSIYKEEGSIARLFYKDIDNSNIKLLGSLAKVNLLMNYHSSVNDFMFEDSLIPTVYIQKYVTKIGAHSFQDSQLSRLEIENWSTEPHLSYIGDFAFSNTQLSFINILDTVTYIGEAAYEKNNNITDLRYSSSMTYVPIGCFANCNTTGKRCDTIRGFSPNITSFENYAFDNSRGLGICQIGDNYPDNPYDCYWVNDESHTKFLDYFPNLTYIGNYAFRGILNIRDIKLNPKLDTIGAFAFSSPNQEYGVPTLLEWIKYGENNEIESGETEDYRLLTINNNAFVGREFNWKSRMNGFDNIIDQTVFIPKTVRSVEDNAFTASSANTPSTSVLRFVLTDAEERPNAWSKNFVTNQLKTVYNYYSSVIINENEKNSLYFLLNDNNAIYARMLDMNAVSILFPSEISFNDRIFTLKEIAEEALIDRDAVLNSLIFATDSTLERIGDHLFTSSSVNTLNVDGTNLEIPQTVNYIGINIPFKETAWYSMKQTDDFVYLNDVCLGYSALNTSLENTTKTIREGTKTIYDNAFDGASIRTIKLPSTLERINNYAFRNCLLLDNISNSFEACKDSLSYIGVGAFMNNIGLREMRYTSHITHVGSNAIANCTSLYKVTFDEGCTLDNGSDPISPILNDGGVNISITDVKLSASVGDFMSTYSNFQKLSRVSNLILGEYERIGDLPEKEDTDGSTYYECNLQEIFGDEATYLENGVSKPIILKLNHNYFDKPLSTYHSDISLAAIERNLLDDEDVVRIIMGYKTGETHIIRAKSDFVTKASASIYRNLFNNRVSVILSQ